MDKKGFLRIIRPDFPHKYVHGSLWMKGNSEFLVNGDVMLAMANVWIYGNARLSMGDSVFIHYGAMIECAEEINIGNDILIGRHVSIRDTDGHPVYDQGKCRICKAVNIEDHVWIGSRSIIKKGVTVGSGSVVAEGSVVTKDVPSGSLVAGVPARVIRENIVWSREMAMELEEQNGR